MVDVFDRAQEREQFDRELAIEAHAGRPKEPQRIIGGVVCCVDCEEVLPGKRLKAEPRAARGIDCQEVFEKQIARGR